jgi:integrase/recombinase XerD
MATLKLILDRRTKKKDATFPIRLYVYDNGSPSFVSLGASLTEKDFRDIFEKTPTGKRLEYRRSFEALLNKAIDLHRSIRPFDLKKFKELLFQKGGSKKPELTLIENIFNEYIRANQNRLKLKTISVHKTSRNTFSKFKHELKLEEVTPSFLYAFDLWYNELHPTRLNSSAGIHLRNLRTIINWLRANEKLPNGYKYPFGKGKYIIQTPTKHKQTLKQEEISKLINLSEFNSREEENSRDLWLMQFYCNGVNMNDLIRLRWDNRVGNCFVIQREKTKTTTTIKPTLVRIPIIQQLSELIEKIGSKRSPYVLGFLNDGMTESQILEKRRKISKLMNIHLKQIGQRLNFSITLLSRTSRDAYATTLKRNGRSIEKIAEMLGQTSIACTRNYLAQFEDNQLHEINSVLP